MSTTGVKPSQKPRLNAMIFALAIEELMDGATTRTELAEKTGLHWSTINLLVTALHRKKVIHISGWERDARGCASIAAFSLGREKDKPKPAPRTNAEYQRDWKARRAKRSALLASAGVATGIAA